MPIISAMPIIISATNFPVQCAMSIICTDLPSTLQVAHCHTFPTGFPESQRATEGNCFNFCIFATCSFFQMLKNASSNLVKNLSWQGYAEELISNGQYWRWRRWWPIGHPRRKRLKLNLGFNWRVCSPFTSSDAHTLYPRVQHWSVLFTPSTPPSTSTLISLGVK